MNLHKKTGRLAPWQAAGVIINNGGITAKNLIIKGLCVCVCVRQISDRYKSFIKNKRISFNILHTKSIISVCYQA